jgi:ankyrin repeat protein
LLQFNADVNQRNLLGETPLMALMSDCEVEERLSGADLLVSRGADVGWKSWRGYTALYWAAVSWELTRLLLKLGATPLDVAEGEPCPLHHACEFGQHATAEMLLDAGAAVNGVNGAAGAAAELRGAKCTPLIRVIYSRADVEDVLRTVDVLAARGAHLDWRDEEGRTCLYHAAYRMPWDGEPIVRALLQRGADPNVQHANGETLLHALCRGHFRHNFQHRSVEAKLAQSCVG